MLLREKDRNVLLEIFKIVEGASFEVRAYGSRVTGEDAHEGSDLDFVIVAPTQEKIALDVLLDLKEKIQESNIPIVVELFDWVRLPKSFHPNTEAQHEVLFRR